jgi:hypothetical protein
MKLRKREKEKEKKKENAKKNRRRRGVPNPKSFRCGRKYHSNLLLYQCIPFSRLPLNIFFL